jgi:hypothetical protein
MGKYLFISAIFAIFFSLTLNPLQSANSTEFEWMLAFGLALITGAGALYGFAGVVIAIIEDNRRPRTVKPVSRTNVKPPLVQPDTRRITGEIERSEFGKQWKKRRSVTYDEDTAAKYAEGGQTPNRLKLPGNAAQPEKKGLWGFDDISKRRK